MNTKHFSKFPLKKGEVIKLTQPKGYAIKADSGRIWITQSNNAVDTFVEAGDSYFVQEDGVLVAEAMSQTMMSMSYPTANSRRKTADADVAGMALQGA